MESGFALGCLPFWLITFSSCSLLWNFGRPSSCVPGLEPIRKEPALVEEEADSPLRMIDERISILLVDEDDLVSVSLDIVHGILNVPRKERRQDPHVSNSGIYAAGCLDEGAVVREDEIGLGSTSAAMRATLVASIEIEECPRHVTAAADPRLPTPGCA